MAEILKVHSRILKKKKKKKNLSAAFEESFRISV